MSRTFSSPSSSAKKVKHTNFHQIDNEILDVYGPRIKCHGYAVYGFLRRKADYSTGICRRLSHREIATAIGASISTVRRSLLLLQCEELIRIIDNGRCYACSYELLPVEKKVRSHTGSVPCIPAATEQTDGHMEQGAVLIEQQIKEEDFYQDTDQDYKVHSALFTQIREYICQSYKAVNDVSFCPWEAPENKELKKLLQRFPDFKWEYVKRSIDNRFESIRNRAEYPRKWLPDLPTYLRGPLNEFGRPLFESGDRVLRQIQANVGSWH